MSQALLGCFLAVNAELGRLTQDLVKFVGFFPGLYDATQRNERHSTPACVGNSAVRHSEIS